MKKRVKIALIIVAMLILCVPFVQLAINTSSKASVFGSGNKIDESFSNNVCSLYGLEYENFCQECDGNVVGFVVKNKSIEAVGSFLDDNLKLNNWQSIASENKRCLTYVCDGNKWSWMFVSLTQIDESVSVTMTLQK